jgi:predicted RecB family nuclease
MRQPAYFCFMLLTTKEFRDMALATVTIELSKTKFVGGCRCLKRLYLQVHAPELAAEPDGTADAIIEQGREVGLLARKLFPGGIEVDGSAGLTRAIRTTKQLVANPEIPTIFEGAFEHEGIIIKTDILQRRKESLWRLVEVKSASDLKDHYLQDVAVQSYVLSGSGLNLASVWLAHINRAYVLTGATVDPRQLFSFRNLTQRAQNFQPELILRLRSQFHILAMPEVPDVPTGLHCINPVVCEFFNHCNTPKPHDHIGYLPRLHASAMGKLEEMGVQSIQDIPADFELSEIQRRACTAIQTGQPWFSPNLKREFESLKFPLYFMDFETTSRAIPRFSGMRPYDQLPFQWSVHVQRQPSGAPEHYEFLATDSDDPRNSFISSLCEALGDSDGSIIVYNEQFESQRLWELASWLPAYTDRIRAIQRRLWDLLPIVRNHVYHPGFAGSYSLKSVLPALVPEMTYEGMEVADGRSAGEAWESLIGGDCDEAERRHKREALLAYCGKDTLAMVMLLERLRSLPEKQ